MRKTLLALCLIAACGPSVQNGTGGDDTTTGDDDTTGDDTADPPPLPTTCDEAQTNHSSVGCDYYAVDMDAAQGPPSDACFTVFVANTSASPAHLDVHWGTQGIDLHTFAKLPQGEGQSLSYAAFDPVAGLPPGDVAILFLAYAPAIGNVACPVPAAIGTAAQISGTGFGTAFHITTDVPVVAYQMLPYGGGAAAATGASLLIPSSAWDTNYVAVSAYDTDAPPIPIPQGPSYNVVGLVDGTSVTIHPKANISAGGSFPACTANTDCTFSLDRGQYAQITQAAPLSGMPVQASQPVGVFGGHQIMSIDRCCGDHGEQMLTPVRALGSEYVAAPHPDRKPSGSDPRIYRIFGTVNGTQLTYDPPNLGAASLGLGGFIEIRTDAPFVVRSQDSEHPFLMFTYMSGAGEQGEGGWGDPDFVRLVPPLQYLEHYVFFTDPTYPFTALTVVRAKKDGAFADVTLDCLGTLSGWQAVGDYEITHVTLVDHWNGQAGCNNGVQQMDSAAPFGVWVWGWGSEDTSTGWVSYGYPAGEGVLPINDVIVN